MAFWLKAQFPDFLKGYAEIQGQYNPLYSSAIKLMSTDYNAEDGCVFTGENVVTGDNESIRNLLEIFDGLLEYLKEEISEESQNGGRQFDLTLFSRQLDR